MNGFSARVFCFFMPHGGFGSHRSDLGTTGPILGPPSRHFGPGTFRGQFWGPGKHTFIMELISHGGSGDFP